MLCSLWKEHNKGVHLAILVNRDHTRKVQYWAWYAHLDCSSLGHLRNTNCPNTPQLRRLGSFFLYTPSHNHPRNPCPRQNRRTVVRLSCWCTAIKIPENSSSVDVYRLWAFSNAQGRDHVITDLTKSRRHPSIPISVRSHFIHRIMSFRTKSWEWSMFGAAWKMSPAIQFPDFVRIPFHSTALLQQVHLHHKYATLSDINDLWAAEYTTWIPRKRSSYQLLLYTKLIL
jgi:hypothetical protein